MFKQICDVVDPGAERPRKRASLIGERGFDEFGKRWGYFQPCSFHTPISVLQEQRSLASGAVWQREATMNSENQERAMSGE